MGIRYYLDKCETKSLSFMEFCYIKDNFIFYSILFYNPVKTEI